VAYLPVVLQIFISRIYFIRTIILYCTTK